jgi:hypothetical protein
VVHLQQQQQKVVHNVMRYTMPPVSWTAYSLMQYGWPTCSSSTVDGLFCMRNCC